MGTVPLFPGNGYAAFTSVGLLYVVKNYEVYRCVKVRRELYKSLELKVTEKEKKNCLSE